MANKEQLETIHQPTNQALQGWKRKQFMRGAVVRLKMINFMTYDNCELFPGPRLNLVLGPNGSGKSTIVCALALGLGGDINVSERVHWWCYCN